MLPDPSAHERAQSYFQTFETLTRVGWGISGQVFLSPTKLSAVKLHVTHDKYLIELEVYRFLHRKKLRAVRGFVIPSLRGHSDQYNLIEMDFVVAPFLVDFAGASFRKPDWSISEWHEAITEAFGPNAFLVHEVYYLLAKEGLYYVDFRHSNLNITDHPDRLPDPPEGD